MPVRSLSIALLLAVCSTASAQKLDLSLSQDTARISFISLVGGTTFGRTEFNAGFLFNEDDNTVMDVGLQVIDMAGTKTPGLELGVGPRLYYASIDKYDVTGAAIALGANFRYKLQDLNRFAIYGSLYYAPAITSFMDAEGMVEYGFRLAYEILPTADAYIGFHTIRMDVDDGDVDGTKTVDSGGFFGMRFQF